MFHRDALSGSQPTPKSVGTWRICGNGASQGGAAFDKGWKARSASCQLVDDAILETIHTLFAEGYPSWVGNLPKLDLIWAMEHTNSNCCLILAGAHTTRYLLIQLPLSNGIDSLRISQDPAANNYCSPPEGFSSWFMTTTLYNTTVMLHPGCQKWWVGFVQPGDVLCEGCCEGSLSPGSFKSMWHSQSS